MNCQEKNYLPPVVCAVFKKAYWNGRRMITSNWTAPRKCKQKHWSVSAVGCGWSVAGLLKGSVH